MVPSPRVALTQSADAGFRKCSCASKKIGEGFDSKLDQAPERLMKKKTRTPAPRATKRRQGGAPNRKPASQRPSSGSATRPSSEASGDGRAEIRRLRTALAQAVARIEQ